jgi:hypothetical protein
LGKYDGAATVFEHRDEVWGDFAARLEIAANGASNKRPKSSEDTSGKDVEDRVTAPEPEKIRFEKSEVIIPQEDRVDREDVTDTNLATITASEPLSGPVAAADEDILDLEDALPAPKVAITPDLAKDLSKFDNTGNDLSQTVKGGSAANALSGGGGDDDILGRGGDDLLIGGSGDDKVVGGAGDDRLVYVVDDNEQSSDRYLGSRGVDTLELYVSKALSESAEFQDDVEAFAQFVDRNEDTKKNGGASFEFSSFDLTVQSTEELEVFIHEYSDLG